jgi:hypothetical protein
MVSHPESDPQAIDLTATDTEVQAVLQDRLYSRLGV